MHTPYISYIYVKTVNGSNSAPVHAALRLFVLVEALAGNCQGIFHIAIAFDKFLLVDQVFREHCPAKSAKGAEGVTQKATLKLHLIERATIVDCIVATQSANLTSVEKKEISF